MQEQSLLIAEDHTMFQTMFARFLHQQPNFNVVATARNGSEVIRLVEEGIRPSLCLLDIQMPEMDGIECSKQLKKLVPNIKIVLLTTYDHESYVEFAIAAGVDGYILKDATEASLLTTLDQVIDGQFVAPQRLIEKLSDRLVKLQHLEQDGSIDFIRQLLPSHIELNERDLKIIQMIDKGWSNRMIADDLYITEGTVKNYISNMYRKLGINNRAELLTQLSVNK